MISYKVMNAPLNFGGNVNGCVCKAGYNSLQSDVHAEMRNSDDPDLRSCLLFCCDGVAGAGDEHHRSDADSHCGFWP